MILNGQQYTDDFDGACYLARYPDVAQDGKYNTPDKALTHWVLYGMDEGRIPGCLIGPVTGGQEPAIPTTPTMPPQTTSKMPYIIAGIALVIVIFGDKIKKAFK